MVVVAVAAAARVDSDTGGIDAGRVAGGRDAGVANQRAWWLAFAYVWFHAVPVCAPVLALWHTFVLIVYVLPTNAAYRLCCWISVSLKYK